jgi:tetratricopeptide (TPR) repeat protein
MTPENARLFVDYILGMADRNAAAKYVQLNAFRLDETFFSELRGVMDEARGRRDGGRRKALDWLMSVASDACGRAYAPFAEARAASKPEKHGAETDTARALRVVQIDQRVTAMLMRTHFNAVDPQAIADWKHIVEDYEAIIKAGPPGTPLYSLQSLRHKVAQALESLASAYASGNDAEESGIAYEEAARAFDEAGSPAEAVRCRSRLVESRLIDRSEYDEQIRRAIEDLEQLDEKQPEYFSRLIDLGELQAQVGDDFAAARTLKRAEDALIAANWVNPSGANLAEVLIATLTAIGPGESAPSANHIATSIAVRGLHRRIHLALADIYRRSGDIVNADDRLRRVEEMERSAPDDEFSTTMRNAAGRWMNL